MATAQFSLSGRFVSARHVSQPEDTSPLSNLIAVQEYRNVRASSRGGGCRKRRAKSRSDAQESDSRQCRWDELP